MKELKLKAEIKAPSDATVPLVTECIDNSQRSEAVSLPNNTKAHKPH
jgi:hypothetical protein